MEFRFYGGRACARFSIPDKYVRGYLAEEGTITLRACKGNVLQQIESFDKTTERRMTAEEWFEELN